MHACFDNAARFFPLLIASFALNASAAELPPPLLFSDSNALTRLSTSSATLRWTPPGTVCVEFKKTTWPGVRFEAGKAYDAKDWSSVGGLALDLRNPGDEPIEVHARVDDDAKANGTVHCRQGHATVGPRERVTLVFPMEATAVGMRAGPPLEAGNNSRRMRVGGKPLDDSHIVAFLLFLAKPAQPRTIEFFSVRWLPKPELRGIVDRFGQYTHAEWPGKLHAETELAERRAKEQRWLREHPSVAERDEFGGWKKGPQLQSTGFFRTEQCDGRWWLVTPSGHLFWSIGSTCVRPESSGPIKGRETMFAALPDAFAKKGHADFYQLNLQRKYGENWLAEWVAATCARLPAWGFNTIANWSVPDVFRAHKVPYTATVHCGGLPFISAEEYKHIPGPSRRLPDFFSERFPERYEAAIVKAAAEWRDDPWCVGWFVDNELAWDSWAQLGTGGEYLTAREAIAAPPALAARQAFVKLLRAKYSSVEAFAKAWGVAVRSWNDPVVIKPAQLNEASRADCSAFMTALAERYFSVVSTAMKKHAPNHLYLGCRFAIRPKEVVAVSAKYCDVVSFNIYADTVDPEKWKSANDLGKPVVIGEFHFGATDRGMFHTGLRPTQSQAERAKAYAAYVRSVLAMPAFVGCHWFQYVDQPLTGRFDGENYNIGLVTVTDTPYPELTAEARKVNAEIYRLHSQAK
ncbi:MAG: beta-galactosidase [Verrucomicrobia bacterium]|nr:beta-galactosidase [Verrucomicrobiota bacterium]